MLATLATLFFYVIYRVGYYFFAIGLSLVDKIMSMTPFGSSGGALIVPGWFLTLWCRFDGSGILGMFLTAYAGALSIKFFMMTIKLIRG